MDYIDEICSFAPANVQEAADREVILGYIKAHKETVLLRENLLAHITSSGFIMNRELSRALLIHHNIRDVWAWTGGHADGDGDLLGVAVREAREETGVVTVRPLSGRIASLDILPVSGHWHGGSYVSAHLHLSVAYILICDEGEQVRPEPGENTGAAWFDVGFFTERNFAPPDVYLYHKLISRAGQL